MTDSFSYSSLYFVASKLNNIRIQYEKCVRIPQCSHEFTLSFLNCLSMEPVRKPRCAVDIEVPADRVSSVSFKSLERINRVSFGFTHLLAVFILYMSKNNDVLIRRLVEEQCGNRKQRVKPSSCLVYRFGDEICRELLLKQFFILKRIVMLRKRHGSAVKPAVDYFRHTGISFHILDI